MSTEPAYRTISEVAALAGVPQHVLRFWETKFAVIAPLKRGGNRRYYRPEDVAAVRRIAHLLHVDGYTIKGAQKLFADEVVTPAPRPATARPATPVQSPEARPLVAIAAIRAELAAALAAARAL